MTTEEALKIAENPTGGHGITGVREAFRVLADALREAQAQTVQMREVVRQDHCDYGDACVLHKMKEVVSTLPAPAARTYDDAIRDAAKAIRDQAIRTFGKPTTVANGYAEVVESLLSPAPAVAPVAVPKPRVIVAPPIDFSEEDAPDEKPVAFDAEKALVAMRAKLIDVMSEQFASDFGDVIDAGLAAGRGAR